MVLLPSYGSQVGSIFSLEDRSILIGGENMIMKLHSDGQLDSTFGFNGIAASSSTGILIYKITLDEMNRILLVGSAGQQAGLAKFTLDESTDVINSISLDLISVYPNPMQDNLFLTFNLSVSQKIKASLFDIDGKLVKNLIDKQVRNPGIHQDQCWLDPALPGGVYILSLTKGRQSTLYKLLKI